VLLSSRASTKGRKGRETRREKIAMTTQRKIATPVPVAAAPKPSRKPPQSPSGKPYQSPVVEDRPYSVRHHGKNVEKMSELFSKSHSVPRLLDEPQSPSKGPLRGRGEVGEIDTNNLRRVKDLADGIFSKSPSVPRIIDSPHSYRAKVEVGEIDTDSIKHVKELADKLNLSPPLFSFAKEESRVGEKSNLARV